MTTIAELEIKIKQLKDEFFEAYSKQCEWFDGPDDFYYYADQHEEKIKKIQDKISKLKEVKNRG